MFLLLSFSWPLQSPSLWERLLPIRLYCRQPQTLALAVQPVRMTSRPIFKYCIQRYSVATTRSPDQYCLVVGTCNLSLGNFTCRNVMDNKFKNQITYFRVKAFPAALRLTAATVLQVNKNSMLTWMWGIRNCSEGGRRRREKLETFIHTSRWWSGRPGCLSHPLAS